MNTPTPPPPAQMKHCPEPAQPSPSVLLTPHLSGAAALLTCVTSVSDPPGQSFPPDSLLLLSLRVGGSSVACCRVRGWPGRLSASAVRMLLLHARGPSHPGRPPRGGVCACWQQSTLPSGLCSGAVGSPAHGLLGDAPPTAAASWPDGSGRVEKAVSSSLRKALSRCVWVRPRFILSELQAALSCTHPASPQAPAGCVVKLPLLQPTKKGA